MQPNNLLPRRLRCPYLSDLALRQLVPVSPARIHHLSFLQLKLSVFEGLWVARVVRADTYLIHLCASPLRLLYLLPQHFLLLVGAAILEVY